MAVKVRSKLQYEDIRAFANGDIMALIVKNYYTHDCKAIIDKIESHPELEEYHYVTNRNGRTTKLPFGVKRLGVPFSSSFGKSFDSEERQTYYREAPRGMQRLRDIFAPYLSPIDKLRTECDEIWPGGAGIGRLEGLPMFTGIVRLTEPDIAILEKRPHVDSMTPDIRVERQFAANIYLETPAEGGELVIYPHHRMLSQEEVHDINVNESLWSHNLGEATFIKPEAGDLIFIHTQIPHAVRRFSAGRRISVQTFFAINAHRKLEFWC